MLAISGHPDQKPHNTTSDLVMHCYVPQKRRKGVMQRDAPTLVLNNILFCMPNLHDLPVKSQHLLTVDFNVTRLWYDKSKRLNAGIVRDIWQYR